MNEEQLILDNIPLIYKCIKDMHLYWQTEDEFQTYYDAGIDGLVKGTKQYDESKNVKLSTFLYSCIKNEVMHLLTVKNYKKRKNEFGSDISLNLIVNENSNSTTEFVDFIPDLNTNIELEVEKKFKLEKLLSAVESLENEKDKLVVKMRYGLDDYEPTKLIDIAEQFGCSRTAIQFRLKRALSLLKKYLEKNDREVFIAKNKEKKILDKKEVILMSQNNSSEKKNTLNSLNDILFAQLEKLEDPNNDDTIFEKEIRKSYAVAQLAQQIVSNTNTCIKAMKLAKEHKIENDNQLKFIGLK